MIENEWIVHLESVRADIEAAESDREALLIAFTELAKLMLEIKFPHGET